MEEFIFQLKSNPFVRFSVLGGFLLVSYVVSGSLLTTALVAIALLLGRMSYNDAVDDIDV
jgi:hypothetical protein